MLWSYRAEALSYSAVKLFSKYSNLRENHTSTSQTDGRTDGRTDDLLWHNRMEPRGKNHTLLLSYVKSSIFSNFFRLNYRAV